MTTLNRPFICMKGIIGVLTVLLLAGCGEKQVEDTRPIVRPVKTMVVGGMTSGQLSFPATVEAGEKALLSFRVGGRLIELPVEEGQTVEEGQLIARLDPKDFQIAIDEANANYIKAASDLRRYQQLYEKNAIPLTELELRRSQRDVAKARLDEAERNLDYTYLRAPFDGQIGARYVENFMDVTAQQQIVDLNDVTDVEIIFDVAENIIKGIRAGWRVSVFAVFEAAPDEEFPLTLKEIAARADPATQTFKVTYLMPQPENFVLLPGMTAEARATFERTDANLEEERLTIPALSVMGDAGGGAFVWVVDPDAMTVHKRDVEVGPMTGSENIVVLDGLSGGDVIVVAGVTKLQDGMKVRLWEEQQ